MIDPAAQHEASDLLRVNCPECGKPITLAYIQHRDPVGSPETVNHYLCPHLHCEKHLFVGLPGTLLDVWGGHWLDRDIH
jgi:hypothetical protein